MKGKPSRERPRKGMLYNLVVVSFGDTKKIAKNYCRVNGGVSYHGSTVR